MRVRGRQSGYRRDSKETPEMRAWPSTLDNGDPTKCDRVHEKSEVTFAWGRSVDGRSTADLGRELCLHPSGRFREHGLTPIALRSGLQKSKFTNGTICPQSQCVELSRRPPSRILDVGPGKVFPSEPVAPKPKDSFYSCIRTIESRTWGRGVNTTRNSFVAPIGR